MGLMKNKKGVVFTIIAILIAIFFTVAFSARIEKPVDHKTTLIQTRISVLNQHIDDFYDYTEMSTKIASYNALQGLIIDISNKDNYTGDIRSWFESCIINGTIPTGDCPGMENKTLNYSLNRIRDLAKNDLLIDSDYKINFINITQTTDAFAVDVYVNLTINISDQYANLSSTKVIRARTSIEGLQDPLYLVNGSYNQTIIKTDLIRKSGDWIDTDLTSLYYNHTYRRSNKGIRFLDRIRGNFNFSINDTIGIESFVNHSKVVFDENDTMTDYYFWNAKKFSCTAADVVVITETNLVPGGDFQIDETHRLIFKISGNDTDVTC